MEQLSIISKPIKQITFRPYQEECLNVIDNLKPGSYLVKLATGLGKCFAPGTRIRMYDGSVKVVEEICENDLVMGADGTPRKVKGLAHGNEEMFRITPNKGEPYTVNKSHILSLKMTGLNGRCAVDCNGKRYSGGDICNITVEDYLKCSNTFKHIAKGWRAGIDFVERYLDIPPYILGVWLGDGTSSSTQITTMEPEILDELSKYCEDNSLQINKCNYQNSGKAITYSITGEHKWKNGLSKKLRKYGVLGNKNIPQNYLLNSRQNRLELLAGLLDTDGYLVDGNVFEFCTVKQSIANDFLFLCRSLGFAAYCHDKVVNGKIYYRINVSGDTYLIPTRVRRRKASVRLQKKNVLVTGIKVESVGMGQYYGFELEGKDRLFLLEDFTVVHNTVVFTNIRRKGRVLVLAHREELIKQPVKYYDCPVGIEMANESSNNEPVVIASVQTLVRRLDKFNPWDFDLIVTDEAHHSAANSYKKIYDYFIPRLHLGFTATPTRGDGARLDDVYQDIIFDRDLKWGIQQGYLSDIHCLRVNIGYDLSKVSRRMGDYAVGELEDAMNIESHNKAIAEAYQKHAKGQTLIFATSVQHAQDIAKEIPGAVAVTGDTKDRAGIIERFTNREIPVLVNCMIFTEGTDIPLVETVMIARPTQNSSLYIQMVGRGLRLSPGKEQLTLIDCVGVTGKCDICTAPTLIGVNLEQVPKSKRDEIEGDLFDLPEIVAKAADCPESWIMNTELVNIWAKEQSYITHNINFFKMPNGDLVVSLPERKKIIIPAQDELGNTMFLGEKMHVQKAIDTVYKMLNEDNDETRAIWDLNIVRRWGDRKASDKQVNLLQRRRISVDYENLTSGQASLILNRIMNGGKAG